MTFGVTFAKKQELVESRLMKNIPSHSSHTKEESVANQAECRKKGSTRNSHSRRWSRQLQFFWCWPLDLSKPALFPVIQSWHKFLHKLQVLEVQDDEMSGDGEGQRKIPGFDDRSPQPLKLEKQFETLLAADDFGLVYDRFGRLIYEKHVYSRFAVKGNVVRYRCLESRKLKCAASLKSVGKKIVLINGQHNHKPKLK